MAKPILLVGVPNDWTIQQDWEVKLTDYHVIFHTIKTDEITFRVLNGEFPEEAIRPPFGFHDINGKEFPTVRII